MLHLVVHWIIFIRMKIQQSLRTEPDLRPATLLKKILWHRCFPRNFVKFLRTAFFTGHLQWLLLYVVCNTIELALNHDITQEFCVICKSSRSQMFFKIGVLRDIVNFTGKYLCLESLINKVAGLNLFFPCEIWKFFKNIFFLRNTVAASVYNLVFLTSRF